MNSKGRITKLIGDLVFFVFSTGSLMFIVYALSELKTKPITAAFSFTNFLISLVTFKLGYLIRIKELPAMGFWIITLIQVLIIFIKHFVTYKDLTYNETDYNSHGNARFLTNKQMAKKYMRSQLGWYLGGVEAKPFNLNMKGIVLSYFGKINSQLMVFGPPGSNKTTALLYTNAFHLVNRWFEYNVNRIKLPEKRNKLAKAILSDESLLTLKKNLFRLTGGFKEIDFENLDDPFTYENYVPGEMPDFAFTDPKKEIYNYTANYFRKFGYNIVVYDFIDLLCGDKINNLDYIEKDSDIMVVANRFIKSMQSVEGSSSNANPIWAKGQALILGAMIAFVKQKLPPSEQNFPTVVKWITSPEVIDPNLSLEFAEKYELEGTAYELYNTWLMEQDSLRQGILGGLAIDLTIFAYPNVKAMTSESTFDLNDLGDIKDKPTVVYIFMDDSGDKTFTPILNLTVNNIFNALWATARKYNSKLKKNFYFILEEAANVGRIDGIATKLGTMRGRRIVPMLIFQSIVQLKDVYNDCWENIMSQCDTKLALGANDIFTAEYISNLLGEKTIKVEGTTTTDTGSSKSTSYIGRPLRLPNEVMEKPVEETYLIQQGTKPSLIYKTQYEFWNTEFCEFADDALIPKFNYEKYIFRRIPKNISPDNAHNENTLDFAEELKSEVYGVKQKPEIKQEIDSEGETAEENEVKIEKKQAVDWFEDMF